ncbi:transferase hexapeptide (six repeat-containing protein) [Marininema mesophilum]|uniref:Transferase hexapeptide (Six repeat-containing protein) n=1 Tax=Marininema mesophilum TaxID=1048340 RepID=A0A1H2THJ6_9BACL|nr:acyltransferase [Marininema mesophilum]SDW42709.1 transferase hexapeptide (six repeat-containing protein) [Marininema mesophilum]
MSHWIHDSVKIGKGTTVGRFSVVEEDVVLGDNVTVGNHVTVHAGTHIGDGTLIADNTVIGRWPRPAKTSTVQVDADLPGLRIGEGSTIGANAVLYRGSILGNEVLVGDQALIREKCRIGDTVVIGCQVAVENQVEIGSRTKIQTNAYITAYTRLAEDVFIAPCVTTTNDNFMGRTEERFQHMRGPDVKRGARVGGGAILLPGVVVAAESFIAAGAVVHRDTEPATVYIGVPARSLRPVPKEEMRKG